MIRARKPVQDPRFPDFARSRVSAPGLPQVKEFISIADKIIYINTAAAPGANVSRIGKTVKGLFSLPKE